MGKWWYVHAVLLANNVAIILLMLKTEGDHQEEIRSFPLGSDFYHLSWPTTLLVSWTNRYRAWTRRERVFICRPDRVRLSFWFQQH